MNTRAASERWPRWRWDSYAESGFSLVEVLAAISIMGVISVGLLTAMGTLLIGSDRARKTADLGSALVRVADAVLDDSQYAYSTACGSEPYGVGSTFAAITFPEMKITGADVTVTSLEWWDGQSYSATCPSPAPAVDNPIRLQRITIEARTPDDRAFRSLQFVKRG